MAPRSGQAEREVRRNSRLRQARTCYGHLAGVAGVQLLEELKSRGWLDEHPGTKPAYTLTPRGRAALASLGVEVDMPRRNRRAFASGCLDWTERRPHLAGFLGDQLFQWLARQGAAQRREGSREVAFLQPVGRWLDGIP